MSRLFFSTVVLSLYGCAMDFAPASLLDEARVLALIPSPIDIDLGSPQGEVEVRAVRYVPSTSTITASRWTFCPISSGVRNAFACVLPECELELAEVAPGLVRTNPAALAAECISRLSSSEVPFAGAMGELPESFETSLRHRMETSDGVVVEAVARLRAYTRNAPNPPRSHPRIQELRIGAPSGLGPLQVREGESLALSLRLSPGEGARAEELYVSYFATAGRFDRLRTDDLLSQNSWTAEELGPEDQEATLYFVARDGRGGQAVLGPYEVEILRAGP